MHRIDKILIYFQKNKIYSDQNAISTNTIAEHFLIHRSDASADLNTLVKKGFLKKCGSRPVIYYLNNKFADNNGSAFSNIIGNTGSIRAQIDLAKAAVLYPPHGLHTLICGESGVGKSLLAESMAIYAKKHWSVNTPFVTFSCADYADNAQLLLTQLFGYVKGAFTGASEEHEGVVDRAQGGILFLDEIHRLPPTGQELLFILIDKGAYRRLGETKAERKANIMLIGATSEDVNSSLLLTFKRRIPVQIHLPPIAERPINERIQLITCFFKQESLRLNLPIHIEGKVIELFSKYNGPANIGELKNDILLCCAKSYLFAQAHNKDVLILNADDLPSRVFTHIRHQSILDNTINQIFSNGIFIKPEKNMPMSVENNYGIDFYKYIDRKIDNYRQLKMSDENINKETQKDLEQYFSVVMKGLKKDIPNDIPTSIIDKNIWQTADSLLDDAATLFHRTYSRNTLATLAWHLQQFKERVSSGRTVYNTNLAKICTEYEKEFEFISQKVNFISKSLNVKVTLSELGFLPIFFTYDSANLKSEHISILVAAHGRTTAQNLADVTNNLLGINDINYYNIPLNQNNTKTINELVFIIQKINNGKGVLVLVDMGFLVTMEKTLKTETHVPIKIIPNVTTALILEAGRCILSNSSSLSEVVKQIYSAYDEYTMTVRNQSTSDLKIKPQIATVKKTILITCMSGHGVAAKIKDILLENISETGKMNIITAGSNDDIKKIYAQEKNNICVIIGSVDPQLSDIPYINVSELFLSEGLKKIETLIIEQTGDIKNNGFDEQHKDLYQILREQLNKFLKSLSAQDVDGCCEEIVEKIADYFFKQQISQDTIVRLYLHLACMFDRIYSNEALKEPEWSFDLKKSRQKEFEFLKRTISHESKKLHLDISEGELCYLLNSLPKVLSI